MLDPTKIGYLRSTPASSAPASPASGPTKAMRNKLVKSGHVSHHDGNYRRTAPGDAALAAFDQRLTAPELETLRSISRGEKVGAGAPGFSKLLESRLIWIRSHLETDVTFEGKALLSDDNRG